MYLDFFCTNLQYPNILPIVLIFKILETRLRLSKLETKKFSHSIFRESKRSKMNKEIALRNLDFQISETSLNSKSTKIRPWIVWTRWVGLDGHIPRRQVYTMMENIQTEMTLYRHDVLNTMTIISMTYDKYQSWGRALFGGVHTEWGVFTQTAYHPVYLLGHPSRWQPWWYHPLLGKENR